MNAQAWVTLAVSLFATTGVLATLWQRQTSERRDRAQRAEHDARSEWWRRYQWAAELATDESAPDRQLLGTETLSVLVSSPLVTASETSIITAVAVIMKEWKNEPRDEEAGDDIDR